MRARRSGPGGGGARRDGLGPMPASGAGSCGGGRPPRSRSARCPVTRSSRAPRSSRRAVTIDAPPEAVWPWIAQMGQDRAGFYSYDHLENLFGLHIHNATTRRARLAAPGGRGSAARRARPGRTRSGLHGRPARSRAAPSSRRWATRLACCRSWRRACSSTVGRGRSSCAPKPGAARACSCGCARPSPCRRPGPGSSGGCCEPVHFVMERRQLLTLRAASPPSAWPRPRRRS